MSNINPTAQPKDENCCCDLSKMKACYNCRRHARGVIRGYRRRMGYSECNKPVKHKKKLNGTCGVEGRWCFYCTIAFDQQIEKMLNQRAFLLSYSMLDLQQNPLEHLRRLKIRFELSKIECEDVLKIIDTAFPPGVEVNDPLLRANVQKIRTNSMSFALSEYRNPTDTKTLFDGVELTEPVTATVAVPAKVFPAPVAPVAVPAKVFPSPVQAVPVVPNGALCINCRGKLYFSLGPICNACKCSSGECGNTVIQGGRYCKAHQL